jgi:Zn-dependent peptidase ImmA (M78 family)/transcriptional regulator with XRE-family HTH domain
MSTDQEPSFGLVAKKARLDKRLGLRQVARDIGISAAYLSRVENDLEFPSGELVVLLASLYKIPVETLTSRINNSKVSASAHGQAIQASPELRALYRFGAQLDSEKIEELIRDALRKQGVSPAEIEIQLASLKGELPRMGNKARDGLFAAEIKPRFLTKAQLAAMAYKVIDQAGISRETFTPPTPIELLVERQSGVLYTIDKLKCDKRGEPLVLGLSGWDERGNRRIVVNSVLADSKRKSDEHRFNFTLAHELFHAIEHLPRIPNESVVPLARMHVFVSPVSVGQSTAEKAVNLWARRTTGSRELATNEDWREWQANTFASSLLMPDWAVKTEFRSRIGAESLPVQSVTNLRGVALEIASERVFKSGVYAESLSDLFAVSRQAMAIRLLQLDLVQEGRG